MSKNVKVIYENGVFRPLEPVTFREHQQMIVAIEESQETLSENQSENCYDIAMRNGIIGMIEDAPPDLSVNPKYFEGFGR
ncbi:MAG: antitoxin family protein [Candidatus Omnitrophota bacterium]